MTEKVKYTSPKGVAHFPAITREETYQGKPTGKFGVKLLLDGPGLEKVKADVDEFLNDTYGPKKAKSAKSPIKMTKGDEPKPYIKFSTKCTDKDGNPRVIPIFDAKGNAVKRTVNLGSGSLIRVKGTMAQMAEDVGAVFYLDAIQIIRLVEYVPGGGFEADEDADGWSGDEFDAADEGDDDGDETPAATPNKRVDF